MLSLLTHTKRLSIYVGVLYVGVEKCTSRIYIVKERASAQEDQLSKALTLGIIGHAQLVLGPTNGLERVGPGSKLPLLQEICITDDMRGGGYGLEFLEAIIASVGPIDAAWVSRSGIALAKKYESIHGAQAWYVADTAAEDLTDVQVAQRRADVQARFATAKAVQA